MTTKQVKINWKRYQGGLRTGKLDKNLALSYFPFTHTKLFTHGTNGFKVDSNISCL